jgi:nucleoside-diphosphate-sugar epimerase
LREAAATAAIRSSDSRSGTAPDGCEGVAVDLTDGSGVRALVRRWTPEVIYHLAALSSDGRSWEEPERTLSANAGGAIELLEAVRAHAMHARVVRASSREVYGSAAALPIDEGSAPAPESPYAVSKLAAEQLAAVYAAAHGLRVVIARPFSHSGPGRRTDLPHDQPLPSGGARPAHRHHRLDPQIPFVQTMADTLAFRERETAHPHLADRRGR